MHIYSVGVGIDFFFCQYFEYRLALPSVESWGYVYRWRKYITSKHLQTRMKRQIFHIVMPELP